MINDEEDDIDESQILPPLHLLNAKAWLIGSILLMSLFQLTFGGWNLSNVTTIFQYLWNLDRPTLAEAQHLHDVATQVTTCDEAFSDNACQMLKAFSSALELLLQMLFLMTGFYS